MDYGSLVASNLANRQRLADWPLFGSGPVGEPARPSKLVAFAHHVRRLFAQGVSTSRLAQFQRRTTIGTARP